MRNAMWTCRRCLRLHGVPIRSRRTAATSTRATSVAATTAASDSPSRELAVDHVIPRSLGGRVTRETLVTACVPCNSRKGNRTPQAANMHLHRTTTTPRTNSTIVQRLKSPKYRVWRLFVNESSTRLGVGA